MIVSKGRDYVSELRPPTGPVVHPSGDMYVSIQSGMILTGKTEEIGEKS
jgi:hypothetical protein